MTKTFFISLLLIFPIYIFSQQIKLSNSENSFRVISSSETEVVIECIINQLDVTKIKNSQGEFFKLTVDGFSNSLEVGSPNLPILKKLIEIPVGTEPIVEILQITSKEINLSDYGINAYLYPALKSTPKNQEQKFYLNKAVYNRNEFFRSTTAGIEYLGTMRSTRIARLSIAPISYNPVKNTLKVNDKIIVKISFPNADIQTTLINKSRFYSPYFINEQDDILSNNFYIIPPTTYPYAAKYVIVADSMFRSGLQPFVKWKQKMGFDVIEAYTSNPQVGKTKTSIKSYLAGLYNNATIQNPAPSFVLFVGDTGQIPVFTGVSQTNHFTDLYYCEYTNDAFPDVLYGRFSAENETQLSILINKSLEYEKYQMANPSFLNKSILIAGVDNNYGPTHANGQILYGNTLYFNSTNSIVPKVYLYPSSGNQEAQIIQDINNGAAIVNYTAHGSFSGWSDPSISISNIINFTNAGKYPLMIGNACETNRFEKPECFGEALVRANNKGALAYIGASNNTFWDEDYYWSVGYKAVSTTANYSSTHLGAYDCMFHNFNEPFAKWATTNAQIIKAGNLAVTQSGDNILYYWEIYHLLGDPSLMVYQKIPTIISPVYSPIIPAGLGVFTVNSIPHSLVAMSRNDTLIASSYADSLGIAVLNFPSSVANGIVDVVITAQNKQPYFGVATITNPTGPYLMTANFSIHDKLGNNNAKADFDENIKINLELKNITTFNTNSVKLKIQSIDTNINIIDSVLNIGYLAGNTTLNLDSIFNIKVKSFIEDNHIVPITIIASDSSSNFWVNSFTIKLNAPKFVVKSMQINDAASNGNGKLEPGENAQIIVFVENIGGSQAINLSQTFTSSIPGIQIAGTPIIDTLKSTITGQFVYNVQVASNIFNGSIANFDFNVHSGLYATQKVFVKFIGNVDEDFETNSFTKYSWKPNSKNPWIITTSNVYQGLYSARSILNLNNSDSSILEITLNILTDDSISFYRKVSSENDYDYLTFFMDNAVIDKWSGDKNWERVIYPVKAGTHHFKWSYSKDNFSVSGMDAGFIDMISFPPNDKFVGLEETNNHNLKLLAYPNPASKTTHILLPEISESNINVQIFDLHGKLIRSEIQAIEPNQSILNINLEGLTNSVYQMRISTKEETYFVKIAVIQ